MTRIGWRWENPAAPYINEFANRGITSEDVADAVMYMLTRPRHVTIRDLIILPSAQEI